jgi:hypothetical protein
LHLSHVENNLGLFSEENVLKEKLQWRKLLVSNASPFLFFFIIGMGTGFTRIKLGCPRKTNQSETIND